MRDRHTSSVNCKNTSTVEIYISATKKEYKYCCKISEIDHIQHNGQGEVNAEEHEENAMRSVEGMAICEALSWVRMVQQTQNVATPKKLTIYGT